MSEEAKQNIVLLSGGLDSTVNLYEAKDQGGVALAITFNYGQRAYRKEKEAAQFFCQQLEIPHKVMDLTWLKEITKTALVDTEQQLPRPSNLDNPEETEETAKAVWVPNRNGVFLNIAASFAEALKVPYIVPGFNKEEAATFPDNSAQFIEKLNGSLEMSTLSKVKVKCFTEQLDKAGMFGRAKELGVNLNKIWSCYEAQEKPCEVCESCKRVARAKQWTSGDL